MLTGDPDCPAAPNNPPPLVWSRLVPPEGVFHVPTFSPVRSPSALCSSPAPTFVPQLTCRWHHCPPPLIGSSRAGPGLGGATHATGPAAVPLSLHGHQVVSPLLPPGLPPDKDALCHSAFSEASHRKRLSPGPARLTEHYAGRTWPGAAGQQQRPTRCRGHRTLQPRPESRSLMRAMGLPPHMPPVTQGPGPVGWPGRAPPSPDRRPQNTTHSLQSPGPSSPDEHRLSRWRHCRQMESGREVALGIMVR